MKRPLALSCLALTAFACGPAEAPLPPVPPPAASAVTPIKPVAPAEAASPYPATRRGSDKDTLHGVDVPDPYRWLEDAKSDDVQKWMTAEDGYARAELAKLP